MLEHVLPPLSVRFGLGCFRFGLGFYFGFGFRPGFSFGLRFRGSYFFGDDEDQRKGVDTALFQIAGEAPPVVLR